MNKKGFSYIFPILGFLFISSVFMMGVIAGFWLNEPDEENTIGFYLYDSTGEEIKYIAERVEKVLGDWVCIDISDIEDMEEAVDVCSHEVAHHIYKRTTPDKYYSSSESEEFAEYCESNITKCLEVWEAR